MRVKISLNLLRWLGVLGFVLWAACPRAKGADNDYIDHALPAEWAGGTVPGAESDALNARWWSGFGDPLLDSLIAIGR